jgi:hypothetical protein
MFRHTHHQQRTSRRILAGAQCRRSAISRAHGVHHKEESYRRRKGWSQHRERFSVGATGHFVVAGDTSQIGRSCVRRRRPRYLVTATGRDHGVVAADTADTAKVCDTKTVEISTGPA